MTTDEGPRPTADFSDVLAANVGFADEHGDQPLLPPRAGRGLAIVTCVDARIEPLSPLGLVVGDAIVFRNLGGQVTDEALTALIFGVHRLNVTRIVVMQHSDCGMTKLTAASAHALITEATGVDASVLEIRAIADQHARLSDDLGRIRASPYIPADIPALGAIVDLRTGRLSLG